MRWEYDAVGLLLLQEYNFKDQDQKQLGNEHTNPFPKSRSAAAVTEFYFLISVNKHLEQFTVNWCVELLLDF